MPAGVEHINPEGMHESPDGAHATRPKGRLG
jgi:hypothetical protein